jgi:hypothetical protein
VSAAELPSNAPKGPEMGEEDPLFEPVMEPLVQVKLQTWGETVRRIDAPVNFRLLLILFAGQASAQKAVLKSSNKQVRRTKTETRVYFRSWDAGEIKHCTTFFRERRICGTD